MASTLVARRLGRIAFGCVLLVGLAYLLWNLVGPGHRRPAFGSTTILIASWLAALAAAALVRARAARLDLQDPAGRLFAASVIAPAVGIALTLPITLHLPFALLLGGTEGFENWLDLCIVITGATHVVFAFMIAVHANQLVAGRRAWSPRSIYLLTVAVSCVPFAILVMIPPILVAVTALPFVPMLGRLKTLVEEEREEAQAAPAALPIARVLAVAETHDGPARRTR